MMARRMFRYAVPVDDQPHEFDLSACPVRVAAARPDLVEFWAESTEGAQTFRRSFQAFGTGHPLPDVADYVGTTQRVEGLVWHLYELT